MSGEDFDDRELASYWKTLGTGPENAEAKFQIAYKIPSDRADALRQTDSEWAKFVAGEEVKIEFEDRVRYYKNRKLHRTDGPAVEYADGSRFWFVDGESHRIDGPAVEWADGSKEWWVDGKRHRIGKPAVERPNGSKEWWVDGRHHRTDGPAVESSGGTKWWYVDGKRHRTDGPAIEYEDGMREWYIDNKYIDYRNLKKYFSTDVLRKYGEI